MARAGEVIGCKVAPETLADARFAPFFEHLSSGEFRRGVERTHGYHLTPEDGAVEFIGDPPRKLN